MFTIIIIIIIIIIITIINTIIITIIIIITILVVPRSHPHAPRPARGRHPQGRQQMK